MGMDNMIAMGEVPADVTVRLRPPSDGGAVGAMPSRGMTGRVGAKVELTNAAKGVRSSFGPYGAGVLGPSGTTEELCALSAGLRDCVDRAFLGVPSVLVALGSSGSGVTHTMRGTDEAPGVLLQVVEVLFRKFGRRELSGRKKELLLSYAYVVGNQFVDLLDEDWMATDGSLRDLDVLDGGEGESGGVDPPLAALLDGLTKVSTRDAHEFLEVWSKGTVNKYLSTVLPGEASDVLVLNLALAGLDGTTRDVKLIIVEAARADVGLDGKFELSDLNLFDRAVRCVVDRERREGVGSIGPKEDCILTRFLSPALGGGAHLACVVCVDPRAGEVAFTQNAAVLALAERVGQVVNRPFKLVELVELDLEEKGAEKDADAGLATPRRSAASASPATTFPVAQTPGSLAKSMGALVKWRTGFQVAKAAADTENVRNVLSKGLALKDATLRIERARLAMMKRKLDDTNRLLLRDAEAHRVALAEREVALAKACEESRKATDRLKAQVDKLRTAASREALRGGGKKSLSAARMDLVAALGREFGEAGIQAALAAQREGSSMDDAIVSGIDHGSGLLRMRIGGEIDAAEAEAAERHCAALVRRRLQEGDASRAVELPGRTSPGIDLFASRDSPVFFAFESVRLNPALQPRRDVIAEATREFSAEGVRTVLDVLLDASSLSPDVIDKAAESGRRKIRETGSEREGSLAKGMTGEELGLACEGAADMLGRKVNLLLHGKRRAVLEDLQAGRGSKRAARALLAAAVNDSGRKAPPTSLMTRLSAVQAASDPFVMLGLHAALADLIRMRQGVEIDNIRLSLDVGTELAHGKLREAVARQLTVDELSRAEKDMEVRLRDKFLKMCRDRKNLLEDAQKGLPSLETVLELVLPLGKVHGEIARKARDGTRRRGCGKTMILGIVFFAVGYCAGKCGLIASVHTLKRIMSSTDASPFKYGSTREAAEESERRENKARHDEASKLEKARAQTMKRERAEKEKLEAYARKAERETLEAAKRAARLTLEAAKKAEKATREAAKKAEKEIKEASKREEEASAAHIRKREIDIKAAMKKKSVENKLNHSTIGKVETETGIGVPPQEIGKQKVVVFQEDGFDMVSISQGDTLWSISRGTGKSVESILELNGMQRSDPLRVGAKIKLTRHWRDVDRQADARIGQEGGLKQPPPRFGSGPMA